MAFFFFFFFLWGISGGLALQNIVPRGTFSDSYSLIKAKFMKQTFFYITHVKAFYKAVLDYSYTSIQVLKITPHKDGAVSFLIESDERDLFWLGVSYGIQMTFK